MDEKDEAGSAREGSSAPAMGRTVGGGISWIVVSTILSKVFTSVAQVALGWLLTREEFGMYAQATAAFGILSLLRDGGASTILIQRGARDYAHVSGALFWMAMVFSTASALGLAAIARPLSIYWYQQPAITTLILILAISMPIGVPGFMLLGKLRIDLRFAEYSKQQTWSALVRQVSTILFAASGLMAQVVGVVLMLAWVGHGAPAEGLGAAWHDVARWAISWGGLGALSLVLPILVVALFDFAMAYRLTRDRPWRREAKPGTWGGYWSRGKWVVFGTLGNVFLDWGPFFVMGRLMTEAATGVFYFAFMITAQVGVLLGWGMQQILLPVLSMLDNEPVRQRQAMVRALHAMMLVGSFCCVGLAVVIDPIEDLVWRGKWRESVLPVIVLGMAFPWRITFGLTSAVLQAQGRYKRLSVLTWAEGLGLMGVTAAACWQDPSPLNVALWTGGWLFVARFAITAYVLRHSGARKRQVLEAVFPAWLLSLIAAAVTFWADGALALKATLVGTAGRLLGAYHPGMALTVGQLARAAALGLICTLAFAVLTRVMLAHQLRDALGVAPAKIRGPLQRLLRL
jgi:O-antigen/teichoic acid export membrane protein